jgi:hypothetical protein
MPQKRAIGSWKYHEISFIHIHPVIGLRKNLQETMVFTIKYGFPAKFPLNQSIEQWDVFRIKSQSAQSDHFWDAT